MKTEEMRNVAEVCGMLADPTRAAIVAILSKGVKPVKGLRRELKLAQPITSHHLALLRMSGLVSRKRKGREMHYSLNREVLTPVRKFLAGLK